MERIVRLIRPWATPDRSSALDSMVMEARDRTANLAFFGAAAVVWVLVGLVVTTRDPLVDRSAGFVGAALMGLAVALTLIPILWLTVFGRHRQIAYQGDWLRAIRRGGLGRHRRRRPGRPATAGAARTADRAVHDRSRPRRGGDAVRRALRLDAALSFARSGGPVRSHEETECPR